MPKKSQTQAWVKNCRELMRSDMYDKAPWYVSESNGRIKLEVLEDNKKQCLTLEYDWSQKGFSKALPRIKLIYKNFYTDIGKRSLKKSSEITTAASSKTKIDFDELFAEFRDFCPLASDKTWNKSYMPVLNHVKQLLSAPKKPIDGEDLTLKALRQWELGSRSRDIARRALIKFLEYAILRGKLSNVYAPVKTLEKKYKPKRVGFALEENQILQLISNEKNPFMEVCLSVTFCLWIKTRRTKSSCYKTRSGRQRIMDYISEINGRFAWSKNRTKKTRTFISRRWAGSY